MICHHLDTMSAIIPLPFLDNDCHTTAIDVLDMVSDDENTSLTAGGDETWDVDAFLPTPPYSPCSSDSGDTPEDSICTSVTPVRPRCNSFLCSCMACECCCSTRSDGPVLRDCMWSATTGLFPPQTFAHHSDGTCTAIVVDVNGNSEKTSITSEKCRKSLCANHTTCCVDPKTIFPYPLPKNIPDCLNQVQQEVKVAASAPTTAFLTPATSPSSIVSSVFDPDSETSTCCSSISDDDMDEIDVVSVASVSRLSIVESEAADVLLTTGSHRLLVLPAAESMSAQVAAIHNYSTTRCQPTSQSSRAIHHQTYYTFNDSTAKCSKSRSSSLLKGNRKESRKGTSSNNNRSRYSGSEDDEMAFTGGVNDERCRRAQHNVMERQRRNHLKGNFCGLRDAVPSLRGEHKVSKVAILRAGAEYARQLTAANDALIAERNRIRALQQRWKWKLSLLQRDMRLSTGEMP